MVGRRKNRAAAQPAVRTPSISTRSGRTAQVPSLYLLERGDSTDLDADESASNALQSPQTPRTRRPRQPRPVPESSRTTRQSARLKPNEDGTYDEDVSPTKVVETDFNHQNVDMDDSQQYEEDYRSEPPISKTSQSPEPRMVASAPASPSAGQLGAADELADEMPHDLLQPPKAKDETPAENMKISDFEQAPFSAVSTPRLSRKRKSIDMADGTPEVDSEGVSNKKLRNDDTEPEDTPESPMQNGTEIDTQNETSPEDVPVPLRGIRSTRLPNCFTKPRGGRGRGRAKQTTIIKRGKKIEDEIWDSENWRGRTPSPTPESQRTKDRQEELSALFKKVGQAQQIALSVVADHNMHRLARDKNSYKECPEFAQVQQELDEHERKAIKKLDAQHKLATALAIQKRDGELYRIKDTAAHLIEEAQDDMTTMLMGKMMALIQGRKVAEDDEHTETDTSDSEKSEKQFLFRSGDKATRQVERGFAADAVRDPEGAIDYDAAVEGWEEFVQKVRMGNLSIATELTDEEALRTVTSTAFESMLYASAFITETEAAGKIIGLDGTVEVPVDPRALSILADTALAEPTVPHHLPPMMRPDPMHRIIPQQQQQQHQVHLAPTDPRSFILPPPNPHPAAPPPPPRAAWVSRTRSQ
ncbi:uncharacterized protein N7506_008103 [Penicillium brevicompactum]|uniref:uncharacterized protein n=1 Tax=Penicillium brevicompactum TaxID=5074 RepID=UPI0025401DAC|nr:uncharacterized protein N7506_008103 [Penicillium brevicompactum]KAJ5334320.1 hypothetical protein N7506_008103 [Penicillium brevicompactum]